MTPPNNRVNPSGRTVTGLAKNARPAPAQPAGYAERYAHSRRDSGAPQA